MKNAVKILIVEHDATDLQLLLRELKRNGIDFVPRVVAIEKDYVEAIEGFEPDIILSDFSLPFFSGLAAFEIREKLAPSVPFIFVSGDIGEENSIEFIQRGITDYVLKDKLFVLGVKVKRALKETANRKERERIEQDHVQSASRLNDAQHIAHIGSWEIDLLNNTQTWSDELYNIYGLEKEEIVPSTAAFLSFVHPGDLDFVKEKVKTAFTNISDSHYNFRFVPKDGTTRYGYAKSHFIFDKNKKPLRRYGIVQDVTEKRLNEIKIEKVNRLYAFISQINQTIVRIKEEEKLFHESCRIAMEFGRFKMAWIGLIDIVSETVKLVAQTGIPDDVVLLFKNAPYQKGGPQEHIVRTGEHYLCNSIQEDFHLPEWRQFATKYGIGSVMILPILKSGTLIGTFNLYAKEPDFFDKEEIRLLVEVTSDISFAVDTLEQASKHRVTEALLAKNEKQFRHTLDNMLEGIQIHDFNWRYIYVNDALVKYSTYTKEALMGRTLMELYPGVEQTKIFEAMSRCMTDRIGEHLESEFVFPDGSKALFELSIDPIPEGIFVLSVDRTEQKKSKDKLLKVNRLYAFISAINQSIVHIDNEVDLLNNAGKIAVEIGQFKMVWIDWVDETKGKLNRISFRGPNLHTHGVQQSGMELTDPLLADTPTRKVLGTGLYAVSNDVQNDRSMQKWKDELARDGIKASISFPIRKFQKTAGVFSFHSTQVDFFDEAEIGLLAEAAGDISFAIETFDKAIAHKHTEALVIKNERRFRALSEKNNDMTTLSTALGSVIYASPSVTKVLGYPLEDLLAMSPALLIHPDDLAAGLHVLQELLQSPGKSLPLQQRMLHRDGKWIWCEGTMTNMLHEEGVSALVSNFRDISEKKAMQTQQEFDRNNLMALLNNTNDLMWSVDRNFRLITSNHAFDEMVKVMSGFTPVKGYNILVGGSDANQVDRFKDYYMRAFAGESFTEIEHSQLPEDFWSEISYYPIYEREMVIGTACFSRNITTQKKAEGHLRLLESVITNITDSVLITEASPIDLPGPRIVYVNDAFTRMTGYEAGEVIGKSPRILQGPNSDRDELNRIRRALKNQISVEVEIINCTKAGVEFYNNFAMVPIPDKDGTLTHWVSIQRDVTSRRQHEETTRKRLEILVVERTQELNEALIKEKELVEMKTKFVAIASHEFRTPLSTISLAAESIRNYFHQLSGEEITRKLAKIEDQAGHMTNLLEDILTIGKSEAGKIKVKRISMNLLEFVETLVGEIKSNQKLPREIVLLYGSKRHMVNMDDKLLRNVITNLLTNALKFSQPDTSVSISIQDHDNDLLIEVTDQGIGIPESEIATVFESFQRASNATDIQGTGLGLSILKKAVELMHGSVRLSSHVTKGSTFSVTLPTQ